MDQLRKGMDELRRRMNALQEQMAYLQWYVQEEVVQEGEYVDLEAESEGDESYDEDEDSVGSLVDFIVDVE